MKTNKINTKNEFELDEDSERRHTHRNEKMYDEGNSKRLDGVIIYFSPNLKLKKFYYFIFFLFKRLNGYLFASLLLAAIGS